MTESDAGKLTLFAISAGLTWLLWPRRKPAPPVLAYMRVRRVRVTGPLLVAMLRLEGRNAISDGIPADADIMATRHDFARDEVTLVMASEEFGPVYLLMRDGAIVNIDAVPEIMPTITTIRRCLDASRN